jgi:hypothetical protein
MKLKLMLEIDFSDAMQYSDAEPFCDFTATDWEIYIKNELIEKTEDIETDSGLIITIKDESGETVFPEN